jgi:hypothetical protein
VEYVDQVRTAHASTLPEVRWTNNENPFARHRLAAGDVSGMWGK